MFESDVELKLADCPEQVAAIVRETIQKVYPHYYPSGAVLFFLNLHSEVKIKERMSCEEICLAMVGGNIIGTGSIRKNEICRLFILPEYQGKGYGNRVMDLLEARIFEKYQKVHVDASFPAESMRKHILFHLKATGTVMNTGRKNLLQNGSKKREYAVRAEKSMDMDR